MGFRGNLQHLRATRNMTQEQLAMLLGVSRQSVSKWEAERAYPEMDKLLKICEIFDCTLDELVTGDLTSRSAEPELSVDPAAPPIDVCGYDETMLRFAHHMAAGVAIILAGVGLSGFFDGAPDDVLGIRREALAALFMFGGIAAGLALIIPAAFERGAFREAHPFVEDFYTPEQKTAARTHMGRCIAWGVGLILLGLTLGAGFGDTDCLAALTFFLPVAAGVGLIVDASLTDGRMNVSAYNDESAAEQSPLRQRVEALYGGIMLGATVVGLLLLFVWPVPYFWVVWPIGGIVCGIIECMSRVGGRR